MLRLLVCAGLAVAEAALAARPMRAAAPVRSSVRMSESALIIQNKGGGHGEIGYHLALELAKDRGVAVTILQEGPNKGKPPHDSYSDLDSAGVKVIWCDDLTDSAACIATLEGAAFSSVIDNWSKSPDHIRPYAELAKQWNVAHYAYVSSAGMYTPPKGDFGAVVETCEVKSSGQRQAEELIAEMGLPYSCFRPQYIYGPKQGKSYLAYFFNRATRGQPILVPNEGTQCVTMTHAADNAAMIAAAIGNPKAVGEVFNCATSNLITYDDLAALCATAAGATADVKHYDPKDFEIPKGFFPFRDTPFFVSADKAKDLLGFEPKFTIEQDIRWYFEDNYKAVGGMDKEVDFTMDEELLAVKA